MIHALALASHVNHAGSMKKLTRTSKLHLNTETVRMLGERQLAAVAGGYTTLIYCVPTERCPHTPGCPQ